jgi:hypothetical protein
MCSLAWTMMVLFVFPRGTGDDRHVLQLFPTLNQDSPDFCLPHS